MFGVVPTDLHTWGMDETLVQLSDGVELAAYGTIPPDATGTVAVLLHGIGMTHRTFRKVQPLLAATMPVLSFDLAGFGRTAHPPRAFNVTDHAEALDRALAQLGVGPRLLVGHSMGAQFAVEHAVLRPDVTAGLVLIGPVVDPKRRRLPAQAGDLAVDTLREPPHVNATVLTDYLRGGIGWYLENLRAMFDYHTEERITSTRCPVVVVRGERDPVAREPWCRSLAAAAPGPSRLVSVPGQAHVVPLTAPAAVAGVVDDLVASPL